MSTKYRINCVQTVYEGATLFVEADTEEEAWTRAAALIEDGKDADGKDIEWKFLDADGVAEIVSPRRRRSIRCPASLVNRG